MRSLRKVLVTGGAGFIGSNIARLVRDETGADVVVLDNLSSGYRENLATLPVAFVQGDVRDADAVRRAMGGCDTVFHLAASVGNTRSIDHPIQDSEINVLGTLARARSGAPAGVRQARVLLVGGHLRRARRRCRSARTTRSSPTRRTAPASSAREKLCLAYAKLYPIECVCLRYFNVYGVNQRYDAYGNVIPIFAHRVLHGEPITIFGDGEQTRDFVNVARRRARQPPGGADGAASRAPSTSPAARASPSIGSLSSSSRASGRAAPGRARRAAQGRRPPQPRRHRRRRSRGLRLSPTVDLDDGLHGVHGVGQARPGGG